MNIKRGLGVLLCTVLFASSCVNLSDTEMKGLKELVNRYNGKVTLSKSWGTEGESLTMVFEQGDVKVDLLSIEVAAHNAAMIMFKNLSEEEREKYKNYHWKLKSGGKEYAISTSADLARLLYFKELKVKENLAALESGELEKHHNKLLYKYRSVLDMDTANDAVLKIFDIAGPVLKPQLMGADTGNMDGEPVITYLYLYRSSLDSLKWKIIYYGTYDFELSNDSMIGFRMFQVGK